MNKACIGKQYPPIENLVTVEAIQKFARAYNHANPFFFDASKAGSILAPLMFGVVWVVPSTERVVDHDVELQVDTLLARSRMESQGCELFSCRGAKPS